MKKWTPEQWKTHLIGQKQLQDFQQGIAELKKSSEDTKKATLKLLSQDKNALLLQRVDIGDDADLAQAQAMQYITRASYCIMKAKDLLSWRSKDMWQEEAVSCLEQLSQKLQEPHTTHDQILLLTQLVKVWHIADPGIQELVGCNIRTLLYQLKDEERDQFLQQQGTCLLIARLWDLQDIALHYQPKKERYIYEALDLMVPHLHTLDKEALQQLLNLVEQLPCAFLCALYDRMKIASCDPSQLAMCKRVLEQKGVLLGSAAALTDPDGIPDVSIQDDVAQHVHIVQDFSYAASHNQNGEEVAVTEKIAEHCATMEKDLARNYRISMHGELSDQSFDLWKHRIEEMQQNSLFKNVVILKKHFDEMTESERATFTALCQAEQLVATYPCQNREIMLCATLEQLHQGIFGDLMPALAYHSGCTGRVEGTIHISCNDQLQVTATGGTMQMMKVRDGVPTGEMLGNYQVHLHIDVPRNTIDADLIAA